MKRKISRMISFVLATILVVTFSAGIVVGVEPTSSDSIRNQPPQALIAFLEDVFFKIGKAENEFTFVDLAPYFENPVSNESYQFATSRIDYYQSFRTKMFDPVENLVQQVIVSDYQVCANGIISLCIEHSVTFSLTHAQTNSSKTLVYRLSLIQEQDSYRIREMTSDDCADVDYRNNISLMKSKTASYRSMPDCKVSPIDTILDDVSGNLALENTRSIAQGNNVLINRNNVVNYSYTYVKSDDAAHSVYNPLFSYLSADCMNFASQCIWAGLSGSDNATAVTNGDRPMDREGAYTWYRLRSGTNSASWQGTLSFNSYINNMKSAPTTESGLIATTFDLSTGDDFSSVPSSVRLGSVVLGSMPSPSHAAIIVKVSGVGRNNVYVNAHNPSRVDWPVGYEWGTDPLRIVSVGSYRHGTTCSHSYSSVSTGNGTDSTCNKCGYSRISVNPTMLRPQTVNSSVSIAAETGILVYSISYKIYSIGSNGIRSSTAIATGTTVHNTNSISGSYRFTQAGLYEVEFSIIDCSTERNTITNSMRIRIQ